MDLNFFIIFIFLFDFNLPLHINFIFSFILVFILASIFVFLFLFFISIFVLTFFCIYIFIGDTANKIGTYSLAVLASHHSIPFYVAAPLTSIDESTISGDLIVIEERCPKELLYSHGGLGDRVAAFGIEVWNPAFDVTPAKLITAIITEKVNR